eukprot:464795_1
MDPNAFRTAFMQCVKDMESITSITDDTMQTITELMRRDPQDAFDINTLMNSNKNNKKTFSETLQKYTTISDTSCNELYYVLSKALQEISKTTQVDVNAFKQTFIEKASVICNQTELLMQMFERNTANIADIKLFDTIKPAAFGRLIRENTTLRVPIGVRLWRNIKAILKPIAQKEQFGQFLSDLDLEIVHKDYHHILDVHINHGNKESVKNVFRFFNLVVHYDESSQGAQCRSINRKSDRLKSENGHDGRHTKHHLKHSDDPKEIWELKHHYAQSHLDIIHCHLVHSNLQRELKRFGERYAPHEEDDERYEDEEYKLEDDFGPDKSKFITESSVLDTTGYGFGVNHDHPYLNPTYDSIHDELLLNELHSLPVRLFQNALVKAIKIHHKHTKRDDALKCKYYDRHYNIIRNEFIGLRHLFALIVYVDMTAFCTHFRRTYRKLSSQKNEDVTGRHLELYYYARALYESIEFFGEYMSEDLKVYHGLDHVLLFSKFTTYFNSPISTTRDLIIANQFSQGRGIILTLEAATGYLSGKHEKAKYVSVSWLSSYPNEDEYLFYGKYVKFKICNIYNVEHGASKGHSEALLLLNKFQKIVNNHDVGWKKGNVWIKSLAEWINEKKKNVIDANCVDMFGKNLFNYFCQDQTKIVINNFVQLPPLLLVALFADKAAISFTEITKVFPQMQVIMLSELDIEPMTASVERYMLSLLQYVKTASNSSGRNLEKIVFKSKVQNDGKQNPTLANKVNKYLKAFRRNGWETGYELSPENAHNLSFTIHKTLSLHPRNVIIADAFNKPANIDHSAKYSPKQGQAPKYFMEVTSVDEDIFHLNVVADAEKDWSRKLFIKDMNHLENTGMVIIRKGQISEGINMEIGAADTYRFAIYATVESEEVISSAFQLELTVLKDEKEMPPHNTQYRPKCVDSATVFQVKDSESKRINVYWSIPPKSFGNVSYRIVINEHHAAMISSLPYSVPFSSIALMNPFRVVTVTETEWNIYESNPSDPISIMHCGDVLSSIEDDYNNPQKAQYNYNYVQDRTPQQAQYNYNYDHDNDSNQAQWARNDDILYNSDDPLRYLTQNKPSTRVKRSNKSSHGGQPKVSRKIKIIKSKGKAKTKEIDSKPSPVPQQMTLNSKQRRDMAINRSKRALATWNLYVDRYEIIAKRYLTQIAE